MPKTSPLAAVAPNPVGDPRELGGYLHAARYSALPDEYQAVRNRAGLFDTSSAAKLRLTGPDAPMFLSNLSTNDIKNLPLGGGCLTYFCDSRAKTLFQAWVYHILLAEGQHALWLETTPGRDEALAKYLDRYLISEAVEIEVVTGEFAQMHLAGPNAQEILQTALIDSVPHLGELQHMERTFGRESTCSIRRHDRLGCPGFDLVCRNERASGVWRMLVAAGATPAGQDAYECLRIEAGTPAYGVDIDETRFVVEIGNAADAISYSKGCYLGQEPIVMSRDRAGHAPRSFVGFRISSTDTLPSPGAAVMMGGEEIGILTSITKSPCSGEILALGYVRWKHREPGTLCDIVTGDLRLPAAIVNLPFRPES
jgi:folate-binding protein YgfZ